MEKFIFENAIRMSRVPEVKEMFHFRMVEVAKKVCDTLRKGRRPKRSIWHE
jgi:hypothetical protein